jgi:hypothetical protein
MSNNDHNSSTVWHWDLDYEAREPRWLWLSWPYSRQLLVLPGLSKRGRREKKTFL